MWVNLGGTIIDLHPRQKFYMFCALDQNCKNFLKNDKSILAMCKLSETVKNGIQKLEAKREAAIL